LGIVVGKLGRAYITTTKPKFSAKMKTQKGFQFQTIIFYLLLCCNGIHLSANNIGLIIAVGDYPSSTGWQKINAANDIQLVSSALSQQGFDGGLVTVLRDAEATREGILLAIQNLLEKAGPGDMVYCHFSGHGQQIKDDNGDELDGYDEAIVPYDSPRNYAKGVYEGERLIRDDELGKLFKKIRKKIGASGQLIVVLDSCHSGSGTRGFAAARGTERKMADSTWISRHLIKGKKTTEEQFEAAESKKMAPMVAFFGASPDQLNFETSDQNGQLVGSLSYAFSKAFSKMGQKTTYRSLFESIRLEMALTAPRQTPQVEGALDRLVLNGNLVEQRPFFRVKYATDKGEILLEGGWLQGLTAGSVIGLYPPETTDIDKAVPLAKGTILRSKPLECVVQTDVPISNAASIYTAWAFLLEQNPGELRVNLRMLLPNGKLKSSLQDQFKVQSLLHLEEPADLILIQNGTMLEILSADEQTMAQFPVDIDEKTLSRKVLSEIRKTGQVKFLRNLASVSTDYNLSMEIIPVELNDQHVEISRIDLHNFTDPGGTLILPEGTKFKIKIQNNGAKFAYFNLLDIQPDNAFTILAPPEWDLSQSASDFGIKPGQGIELPPTFEVGKPYGQEIMKLIATDKPVDLRNIKLSGGALLRGPQNSSPLEKLFSDTFFSEGAQSRAGKVENVRAGALGISTIGFVITK